MFIQKFFSPTQTEICIFQQWASLARLNLKNQSHTFDQHILRHGQLLSDEYQKRKLKSPVIELVNVLFMTGLLEISRQSNPHTGSLIKIIEKKNIRNEKLIP